MIFMERGMTKMYQAYAGKVLDGKPVILESVMLPENADLVITILNEFPPNIKTRAERQADAIKRFMAVIDTIDDEIFTDEDYYELENNRANFHREIEI